MKIGSRFIFAFVAINVAGCSRQFSLDDDQTEKAGREGEPSVAEPDAKGDPSDDVDPSEDPVNQPPPNRRAWPAEDEAAKAEEMRKLESDQEAREGIEADLGKKLPGPSDFEDQTILKADWLEGTVFSEDAQPNIPRLRIRNVSDQSLGYRVGIFSDTGCQEVLDRMWLIATDFDEHAYSDEFHNCVVQSSATEMKSRIEIYDSYGLALRFESAPTLSLDFGGEG